MNGLIASTFWLHKNGGLVEIINKFIDEGGSWWEEELVGYGMNVSSPIEYFIVYFFGVFIGGLIGLKIAFTLIVGIKEGDVKKVKTL